MLALVFMEPLDWMSNSDSADGSPCHVRLRYAAKSCLLAASPCAIGPETGSSAKVRASAVSSRWRGQSVPIRSEIKVLNRGLLSSNTSGA